jgi:ketosteroid isomerase-like protein
MRSLGIDRLRDTHREMPEESTTPDLVELVRGAVEAANDRDMDAFMSGCPPDGVYDTTPSGLGVYEGPVAIRAFIQEWWDAFEDLRFELEEVLDLGNGVTFSVVGQEGRPAGSASYVRTRQASVTEWLEEGMAARITVYTDIDEARAAAERLAGERW